MRKIREATIPFHLTLTDKFFFANADGSEHDAHPFKVLNKLKPYLLKNGWRKRWNDSWTKRVYTIAGNHYHLILNHPDWRGEVLIQISDAEGGWEDSHVQSNLFGLMLFYAGNGAECVNHPDFPNFMRALETEYRNLLHTGHVFNLYGQLTKADIRLSMDFNARIISHADMVVTGASLLPLESNRGWDRPVDARFYSFDAMKYLLGESALSDMEKARLFEAEYGYDAAVDQLEELHAVDFLEYCDDEVQIVIAESIQSGTHLLLDDFAAFLTRLGGYTVAEYGENQNSALSFFCQGIRNKNRTWAEIGDKSGFHERLGVETLTEYRVHYEERSRTGLVHVDEKGRVWGFAHIV